MFEPLVIATSGLVAGSLHVLSGPDHLAAVAPLAADSRGSLWRSGFLWGVGHTSGVVAVALAALALRALLPIDRFSSFSERAVGLALIFVGVWGLRRALRSRVHVHAHVHDGSRHSHIHVHDAGHQHTPVSTSTPAPSAHDHVHASFSFGILHGFAGSSHLFGVLPALALPTQGAAVLYLGGFGVGTIVSMTAFASVVGVVAARARQQGTRVYRGLLYACSIAAILVGGFWLLA